MTNNRYTAVLGGIAEAFGDRNFRVYSVGSIASWASYFVQLVAVAWLTWELTGSTMWLAIMALIDIVPSVLLLPFTGAFADRFDRYKIMIWVCTLSLVQAIALAALAWFDVLTIVPLAILQFIHAVIIAFMVPAMYGTLPRFINAKVLPSAIAVSSSYVQVAIFAGPAFSGWLIAHHGVFWAFATNALGYLILTICFIALRTPDGYKQPEPDPGSIFHQIASGVVYLCRDRRILTMLVLATTVNALGHGFFHMMPAYSETILGMGVGGMSAVLAAEGLGATVAALWIARGGAKMVTINRVLWAVPISILAVGALIMTHNFYIALAFAVILGLAAEVRKVGTMTLVQLEVDEKQRGRVMGTWYMFAQIAAGIGAFGIGTAATSFGLVAPTLIGVAIGLAIWATIFCFRRTLLIRP